MTADNPVPDYPAHVVAALTPESKATFVQQMIASGHSKEALEAKLAPPQPVAPVNDAAPNAESIRYLRENWSGDKATLNILLAQLDAQNPGVAGAIPPSLQAPAEYNLNFGSRANLVPTDELAALQTELVTAYKAMGLPEILAQPLTDAIFDSADKVDGLTPNQLANFKQEQRAMLAKAGDVKELVRLAAVALLDVDPDVFASLRDDGSFETAEAIMTLASAGRAREYREKRS
jgi:hypothetical protein